jgi:hypothetical protein
LNLGATNPSAAAPCLVSISWPEYALKLKKSPKRVEIDPSAAIPSEYMRQKVIVEPDKEALKKAIKERKVIDGVHLQQTTRLEIT